MDRPTAAGPEGAAVSLLGVSIYMPEQVEPAEAIAAQAGLPRAVVETKFGLKGKRKAGPDEHVSDMAVKAARPLLELVDPSTIDAVIYFGSPHKDYYVWLAAPKIQHELGLTAATAFEVSAVSAGCPIGLSVARSMLAADPSLRNVLLVGASRESYLIEYSNVRSRFMFNFGDGAAAALLGRGPGKGQVLATAAISDGSFHEFVRVPAGGSRHPASPETIAGRMHYLDVTDPAAMKERLDPVSAQRFIHVARAAAERSGCRPDEIRFIGMLHTKRSLFDQVMAALGIPPERQVYLDEYGHMSAIDPLVALYEAERRNLLAPGDLAVLLSAGTGYTWAATAIRWGP